MILGLAALAAMAAAETQAAADAVPPEEAMARLDRALPGTSANAALALFPEGPGVRHLPGRIAIEDVAVAPGCEADGEIRLGGGIVTAIELRGEGALLGRCGGHVLDALAARFGPPDSEKSRGETPWRRSRTVYEWRRGGATARYVRYTSAGYAGTGLASASWVLNLSADGSARAED